MMKDCLSGVLVDPVSKAHLSLEVIKQEGDDILEGKLYTPDGKLYPITNGIPRFVLTEDSSQQQTAEAFGYKWNQRRNTFDSPAARENSLKWQMQRYGVKDLNTLRGFFYRKKRILDAGCGNGFSSSLWLPAEGCGAMQWYGVDISLAVDAAQDRLKSVPGTHFVQADILQLPFREQTFDAIISEGVLHHTRSTEKALKALVPLLEPGGEIRFYIYRKKGPIREFSDDYIREVLSVLPPEEAWEALRPLTRLGQALAELHVGVEVPEDIPYLGIQAGRYDVQRLIYWNFAKMFWNSDYSFEDNHHVNFDWYQPHYAHRQTEEDVRRWCEEAGLKIVHFDTQESGFSVRGVKV